MLPKSNILAIELYVMVAYVEDVVSFKRNRETILAESLVKLGFEAGRRRTEPHVLLASTGITLTVYINSDKKMKTK